MVSNSSYLSNVSYLEKGIFQGSVLSFLMINDLPENFESSIALFADALYFREFGTNIEELNKLTQNSLNKINV